MKPFILLALWDKVVRSGGVLMWVYLSPLVSIIFIWFILLYGLYVYSVLNRLF